MNAIANAAAAGWRGRNELPLETFRRSLGDFLEEKFPPHLREGIHHPMGRLRGPEGRKWVRTLYEHGWRAPHWPKEWGGLDLSVEKQIAYFSEMDRHGVTRVLDFGGIQFAPILIEHGTDAQKRRFLHPTLCGDIIWAQGFSEPNAGSDLASLATRAIVQGDWLVINGSKIWTTQAADADHIFMLVRTGSFAHKQQGISFVIADLTSPGISMTPIRNIAGEEEFYQVFFDDVAVPLENVVGRLDEGWELARSLLGIERLAYGNPIPARRALDMAQRISNEIGRSHEPALLARFAALSADIHDAFCLYDEVCTELIANRDATSDLSLLKVFCTELHQRAADLVVEVAGEYAAIAGRTRIGQADVNIGRLYAWVRAPTIFGGTSEIQRGILARKLFGSA